MRKQLQLGMSRLDEYAKRSKNFEGDLALPAPTQEQVKEKIEKTLKEVDLKLSTDEVNQ